MTHNTDSTRDDKLAMRIVNTRMMRQAILTRFFGPTNVKGSRVIATCEASRHVPGCTVTMHWDHALNGDENHAKAAIALANKLGWTGEMAGGSLPGSGYAFVWLD